VLLAGLALVAAACTTAAATPTPTPTPADPTAILTKAVLAGANVKSFHVSSTLDGTINVAAIDAMMGRSASGKGTVSLNGTTATADVDVAGRAVHATLSVPSFSTNVELIALDHVLYYKVSLLGDKFHVIDLSGLPARPTPGPSQMTKLFQALVNLRQKFDAAGGKIAVVGVDQVDGKDAQHLAFTIPIAFVNQAIAAHMRAAASAEASGAMGAVEPFSFDSLSLDAWFYSDSGLPARTELKAASSQLGSVDAVSTFTGYDQPVNVTAPSPDQIQIGKGVPAAPSASAAASPTESSAPSPVTSPTESSAPSSVASPTESSAPSSVLSPLASSSASTAP
jgi:hypothetical protein